MVGGERAYLGLNGWYPSFTASSALARDHLSRRFMLLSQNLTHQKQIGEQRAEMDGSVQIVDQLGADGGLCQNQLDGGKRIASVAIEHREERQVFVGWFKAHFFDCQRTSLGKTRQGFHGAVEELADLSARFAALVTGQPLGCIGEHKLVALFHSVTAIPDLSQHRLTPQSSLPGTSQLARKFRPAIALDRALSDKSLGPSSRKSLIS